MRSASAAPIFVSTEWKGRAVTSLSVARFKSGTVFTSRGTSRPAGKPWLLRFFDQIRFYPVSAKQLLRHRENSLDGKFNLTIEEETFRLRDYHAFLARIAPEAAAFKAGQQAAFEAERDRWASREFVPEETASIAIQEEVELPEGGSFIDAPVAGNLWKLLSNPGDRVEPEQPLAIIESMKMEMQVCATRSGTVHSILCQEFSPVAQGQHLFVIS
jgi:urea carboxylase